MFLLALCPTHSAPTGLLLRGGKSNAFDNTSSVPMTVNEYSIKCRPHNGNLQHRKKRTSFLYVTPVTTVFNPDTQVRQRRRYYPQCGRLQMSTNAHVCAASNFCVS
ncbi:hypothetical protein T12_15012 [Trichinella patagoniensis]|uniref:Uncharacterized protein n=1 Tax=Trichinella patagoniensis TaxID=990121 RepID=A0A0V0Z7E4_9BILA|nr:hypothetical protein T12_15012 [Trichinella patagoniensis]